MTLVPVECGLDPETRIRPQIVGLTSASQQCADGGGKQENCGTRREAKTSEDRGMIATPGTDATLSTYLTKACCGSARVSMDWG